VADALVIAERHEAVALLRLNRPDALNAMSNALREQLLEELLKADRSEDVRSIVVTGTDTVFVAGADVAEFAGQSPVEMLTRDQAAWWAAIRRVRKPMIAAVRGYALGGGCELALACDMIVASETAEFGQPEVRLGLMPGGGGTQLLTRILGKAQAMELLLTGRRISASEARELGFVTRVVPDGEVVAQAMDLAARIAKQAPAAVRLIKDAVLMAEETTLEAGLIHERHNFILLFGTQDAQEGMNAFLEKRRPAFTGC
jgi:enoyl-CoA hydratase